MKNFYLSYLMGADNITDKDITDLGITVEEKINKDRRTLIIPKEKISQYINLVKTKLNKGFWNEVVGENEIIFIFKFEDGSIKEYKLSLENEEEISKLCTKFNKEPEGKTRNIYRYISNNKFYHDFMLKYYFDLINRV